MWERNPEFSPLVDVNLLLMQKKQLLGSHFIPMSVVSCTYRDTNRWLFIHTVYIHTNTIRQWEDTTMYRSQRWVTCHGATLHLQSHPQHYKMQNLFGSVGAFFLENVHSDAFYTNMCQQSMCRLVLGQTCQPGHKIPGFDFYRNILEFYILRNPELWFEEWWERLPILCECVGPKVIVLWYILQDSWSGPSPTSYRVKITSIHPHTNIQWGISPKH